MPLSVIKFNGEEELFSKQKVYKSARKCGASKKLAEEVSKIIEGEIYSGIKTLEIFRRVKSLLSRAEPGAALKFNLKKAIRKLGPTGFPFEEYVREILREEGFRVKDNRYIRGKCCEYEIDFLAEKGKILYVGECKYRNLLEGKVHSPVALESYAKFLDISNGGFFNKSTQLKSFIVSSAKFTKKTIRYSNCVGIKLLGWNYPRNKGLEYLISNHKLYPITILSSLNRYLVEVLMEERIMSVQDLLDCGVDKLYRRTKIPKKKLNLLIKEAETLLGGK